MTFDELKAVAAAITFQGLLRQMRMQFVVEERPDGDVNVDLIYWAFDSREPVPCDPQPFTHSGTLRASRLAAYEHGDAVAMFADMIGLLLMHEQAEGMFVDGKRESEPQGHDRRFSL